jgi:uncharacterized protein (UPF0332 family)
MDFRDYLNLARTLVAGPTEAEWRSATSRAYYAAFHVARVLLLGLGFRVPQADRAHGYLWMRLSNAGQADVMTAGRRLGDLRRERNRADYDDHRAVTQATAAQDVRFYTAFLAGAGLRGGRVCGAPDAQAAYVKDRPVRPADVVATV